MLIRAFSVLLPLWVGYAQTGEDPRGVGRDSLLQAGIRAQGEGRLAVALLALQKAREDSATALIAFHLGTTQLLLNDFNNARASLEEAVQLDPERLGYRFQLARLLVQIGSPAEGARQYEAILERDSAYLPALFQLGLLHFERREYGSAASRFERLVRLNPRDFLADYYLGAALTSLGLADSARKALAASLTLQPGYVPAMALLASLYYGKPEYGEALRLYAKASALRPENADLHYRKGLCEERLDRYREALASFTSAVERDTSHVHAFAHLGQVWFQLGKYDSAIIAYEKAVSLEEDNPSIYVNIALAWERRDSIDRAAAAFRRAVEASQPGEIAKIHTQLAAVYFNAHRYPEAEKAYRLALQLEPGSLLAMFFLAVTQDQMHKQSEALRSYRRFLASATPSSAMADRIPDAQRRVAYLETTLRRK